MSQDVEWREGLVFHCDHFNQTGIVKNVTEHLVMATDEAIYPIVGVREATNKEAKEYLKAVDEQIGNLNVEKHHLNEWLMYSDS